MKTRVYFDTSILGMGHFHPQAKTGISRVVESLLGCFLNQPNLDIQFVTNEALQDTLSYLTAEGYEGIAARLQSYPAAVFGAAERRRKVMDAFRLQSVWQKAARRLTNRGAVYLPDWASLPAGIYFSGFHPIPEAVQQRPDIAKVIILHDVISLIMPELIQEGNRRVFNQILASITSDTQVVCISESTRNDFLKFRQHPPQNIHVIPLAASSHKFYHEEPHHGQAAILKHYGLSATQPFLLSVATLEPRKNTPRLIQAFVAYKQAHPGSNLQLVLAGTKGWDFDPIFTELALTDRVRSAIHFVGFVADGHLSTLYSKAVAFVYPSLYEGFGLPVLEAMQCGAAVITSGVSSLPEVAADAALLIDPTSTQSLKDAITTLVDNPEIAAEMRRKSLVQARQFSWDNTVLKYLELFAKIAPNC